MLNGHMPRKTPIKIQLTDEERFDLEHRARSFTAPHRTVVRAKIILGLAEGKTVSEIARTVQQGRRHVRKWAHRFIRKRLRGLEDKHRSGRPPRFSPGGGDTPGQDSVRATGGTEPIAVAVDMC